MALLFYGHSYPNDFLPVVQALAEKLGERYNLLPIAFSQNEDGDLKKLRAFLTQKKTPVSAVVNLMPFRLGAAHGWRCGAGGGNPERTGCSYFKPFCLTRVSGEEWERAGCRESRRVSYQHPASGAGRRDPYISGRGYGKWKHRGRRTGLSTAGT